MPSVTRNVVLKYNNLFGNFQLLVVVVVVVVVNVGVVVLIVVVEDGGRKSGVYIPFNSL